MPPTSSKLSRLFQLRTASWLFVLAAGTLIVWQMVAQADRQMRAELLRKAHLLRQVVSNSQVRELAGAKSDLSAPDYRQLKERLADACLSNPECRFLYLLGRKADGAVFFFVDSEPDGSKDNSPPGTVYNEASEALRQVFSNKTGIVEGPVPDQWGVWVSALVPMFDPGTDTVVAVFGMDVTAGSWTWNIAERVALPVGAMLVLLIGAGVMLAAAREVTASPEPVLRRLLPPLTLLLLLLLTGAGGLVWRQEQQKLDLEIASRNATANRELQVDLSSRTSGLGMLLHVMATAPELAQRLRSGDAAGLQADWQPSLKRLFHDDNVECIQFLDAQRKCLLRLQPSEERGDVVSRFTTREAERTGRLAAGLELGPLGTLTLWVVQPVFTNGTRVGFVEIGDEIDEILRTRRSHAGLELAVTIPKKLQSQPIWEAGMRQLGREADWNRLPHRVITYASQGRLPEEFSTWANLGAEAESSRALPAEITAEGRDWRVSASSLRDAEGREVASLLVMHDVTNEKAAFARVMWLGVAVGGVLLAGLLGFVFVLLRRTDLSIRAREAVLAANEKQYRLLADNTDDFVTLYDAEWRKLYTSPAYYRRTGWTPEDLDTHDWHERIPPEDLPIIERAREAAQVHGEAVFEHRIRCRDVAWLWVEARAKRLPLLPPQFLATAHDITARKKAEQALLELNQQLERRVTERTAEALALYNNAPCGYHSIDADGVVVQMNDTELAWLGYRRDEVEGRLQMDIFLMPESAELFRARLQQYRLAEINDATVEWDMRRKDGSTFTVLVNSTAVRDAAGNFLHTRSTMHNITERKLAEVQLRKLQSAIDQGPTVVMITNREGVIEYVNPRFVETTGYTAAEALGQNPRLLKSGAHPREFYDEIWRTLLAGQTWRGELCNKRKDGSLFWESAAIAPIRDNAGRITHFVGIKEDITELRRITDALRQAKEAADAANRAKSTFLANMSHEIRSPMHAILGFAQLMQRDTALPAAHRQRLDTINRSGEHLLRLINDILDMSKIESGRMSLSLADCDFVALLAELEFTFRLRAEEKHLRFDVRHAGSVPSHLYADAGKVRQVLFNIFSNALKFTAQGSISLRTSSGPVAVTTAGQPEARLCLEVEDTGPGIAAEELERVFEAFEQTQSGRRVTGGTGLGMAISRQLARMMGGDLTVTSQVGVGSTFRFTFRAVVADPVLAAEATASPLQIAKLKSAGPAPRVLVVDDMPANRELLRGLLEDVGFIVSEATGGAEAVAHCQTERPALILMDLRMPGMDGLAATRAIRAGPLGQEPRILVISADVLGSPKEELKLAGADGFVGKPYRSAELLARIGTLLDVGYSYAPADHAPDAAVAISAAAVAQLSELLRAKLVQATESGDVAQLKELIAREVNPHHPDLARALSQLAERYAHAAILSALK